MRRTNKAVSILLTLTLLLALAPALGGSARATVGTSWSGTVNVTETETINGCVTVTNDTTLTIAEGVTLTVNGSEDDEAITVSSGKTLTVTGPGTLKVNGKKPTSGGGGKDGIKGNLKVTGGTVTVTGGDGSDSMEASPDVYIGFSGGYGIRGNLTVTDGTVTVSGGRGTAGANGGIDGNGGDGVCGTVTVSGGSVMVIGGIGNARGGTGVFDSVTLSGGTLTAAGGQGATSGGAGVNSNVTLSGGTFKATGGIGSPNGAGVGGSVTIADNFIYTVGSAPTQYTSENSPLAYTSGTTLNPVTNTLTIDGGIEHGTLTANRSGSVPVGASIVLTATPAAGYVLDKLTKSEGGEAPIELESNAFTMPDAAMTVSATFRLAPTPAPTPAPRQSSGGSGYQAQPFSQSLTSAVPSSFDGGSVAVSPANAGFGDTVTLTVTPDEGMRLVSLTIDRIGGEPVELTDKGNNTYSFTMPGWRIAVNAQFEPIPAEQSAAQPAPEAAQAQPTQPAQPTLRAGNLPGVVLSPQRTTVNGAEATVESYNIGGTNYFSLRDLAALLSGTPAQFNVEFDADRDAVVITKGATYNGAVNTSFTDRSDRVVPSYQTVFIDGVTVSLTAYNIGGNNFFGLRELSALLGYSVDYDEANNTAIIESR